MARNYLGGVCCLVIAWLAMLMWRKAPTALTSTSSTPPSLSTTSLNKTTDKSALSRARDLAASKPQARGKENSEFEGHEWWEKHEALLNQAWAEFPRLHPELYTYDAEFERLFIHPDVRKAVARLRDRASLPNDGSTPLDESHLRALFVESAEVAGVWKAALPFGLFTQEFCRRLLSELDHIAASGIPMRRPNGMNRYGAILDHVGFDSVLKGVIADYVRPLAEMLFPAHISGTDAAEHFAFTIEYRAPPPPGASSATLAPESYDVDLKGHRDASVATLNVCLGYDGFEGGRLRFREDDVGHYMYSSNHHPDLGEGDLDEDSSSSSNDLSPFGGGDLPMQPGAAILHKGQHHHAALPLTRGRRLNLIIWLMGEDGVVRVAPYDVGERLTAEQRWARSARTTEAPRQSVGPFE